ncbi:MAG: thioesterase II family protein [Micromonosporaceae bacterium]
MSATNGNAELTAGRWVVRWKPRRAPLLRVLCFPYAGGGASVYRTWPDLLPAEADVCAIQMPGRESRIREAPLRQLAPVVSTIAGAIRPLLDTRFVLFGHSLGALIAFELARELGRAGLPGPEHLFVSGRRAPQLASTEPPIHAKPAAEFIRAIRRLEGTPAEFLENPELLDLLLPTLRSDFAVGETYSYLPSRPLDVPLTAFYGHADKVATRADAAAWRHQTTRSFTLRGLPGGHFFLRTAQWQMLKAITADLLPLLRQRPVAGSDAQFG